MKIFYLCDIDLNTFLGGTRHVLEVVKNMGKLGNTVRLYAPQYSKPNRHITYENVEAVFIPTLNLRIVNWVTFYLLSILYIIKDLIIGGRPDLIYSREMVYNIFLPFFCRISRIPLIIEVNALLTDELEMIGKGRVEIGLIKLCQGINFRFANSIIAVTDEIKTALQEIYGIPEAKITVVSNGTDAEHFKPIPEEEAREKIGFEKDRRYIGFVGSCYLYHDIPALIRSAPLILERYPETRFIIVGDGVARKGWEEMVKREGLIDSFLFTGYRPYDLIPYYINAFDICTAPLLMNSAALKLSPLKVRDYLACGKAVVATGIGEVGDIIKDTNIGVTVPPHNPEALAEAIIELLKNPSLIKEMGKKGREYIVERFTWERKVREIMCFVES